MAKVILDANETYTVASASTIFGAAGSNETVKVLDGAAVTFGGDVERVEFAGASTAFTYKATTTGVQVLKGTTVVANVVNNQKLAFTDGSATVSVTFDAATASNVVKVGTQTVTATAAAPTFTPNNAAGEASTLTAGSSSTPTTGQSFTLTAGIDNIAGTAGNDTIDATVTATSAVLGGLDKVDGGAGVDTLNIADTAVTASAAFALPAGFSISNVENVNVTTNGNIGATGAGNSFDLSGNAAVTSIKGVAAGAVGSFITASATSNVDLTVAGAATATVTGGKAVSVTGGTGATAITGKGLTSVTVKNGGAVTIDNLENTVAATTAKGTTLTSVTLDSVNADSAVKGEGLTDITIKGATVLANTVTVTNAKADHALTVNVDGTGYKTDGTAVQTVVVDTAAKTITVNATGSKSSLALTGSTAATTVNITGSADLTLAALASATKIDGSAATGGLTLGDLNAGTVTVSTGAGKDSFVIQATAKVTADAGAGDDTVTLKSALAAGSTLNLGAGNDKLLNSAGSVATSTATAVTVIDAGDGTDTVSASLINAGNAAQFKNFEALDISAAATLDVELMTGSTITGLTLTGSAGTSVVSNVATGVGLTVSGDNTGGTHTINVKGAAAATDNTFAITFDGAAAATAPGAASIKAGTTILEGIESISIASAGGANTWNSIALTDAKLKTVTITGDKNLDLTFVGTNGTNTAAGAGGAVNSIDGSAATGKLSINTTNVVADDKSGVGLTVKGGSANDTITLAQKATVLAGAGDDSIVVSDSGATVTGGDGKDTINVSADLYSAAADITTITDFVLGTDKLTLNDLGTEVFNATKVDISAATTLEKALGIAIGNVAGNANAQISWFQYGGNTFIVENQTAAAVVTDANTTDIVVKLTGLIDLSGLTVADFNFA